MSHIHDAMPRQEKGPTMDHHNLDHVPLPPVVKLIGILWGGAAMIGNWWNTDHFLAVVSAIGPILIGIAALKNAETNARKARGGK